MNKKHQPDTNLELASHIELILNSFRKHIGQGLVADDAAGEDAELLYQAPFAVLSHDTAKDPIFNYANLAAQELFEMDWQTITKLPSRLSAEPVNQEERALLLAQVEQQGYIDSYRGIRISATGKRFQIEKAIIWNLMDENDVYKGQAAALYSWSEL